MKIMAGSLVIIPTFNEIENIDAIIRAVFGLKKDFHILVVDDNSPDGTADHVMVDAKRISRSVVFGGSS